MALVTLANGQKAEVTPDNWQELAALQIQLKGGTLNERSATLDAFKQLAGLGNGFYTVTSSGAAAPRSMGEERVFNQPLVRLSDDIAGNPNPSSRGFLRDASDSAIELAKNARDQAAAAADALRPPGGFSLWLLVSAVVAGGVLVYVATR
jgi:hypothetical protein